MDMWKGMLIGATGYVLGVYVTKFEITLNLLQLTAKK